MPALARPDSSSSSSAGGKQDEPDLAFAFDLELGGAAAAATLLPEKLKRARSSRNFYSWKGRMFRFVSRQLQTHHNLRPVFIVVASLVLGLLCVALFFGRGGHELRRVGISGGRLQRDASAGNPYARLRNLVMVAGHAVFTSSACAAVDGDASWYLESYQKHLGQASTFVEHIRTGVEAAAGDDGSLLLFSGGETRKEAGPRSEAQSYWGVAESKNWFGKDDVRERAMTEEHARDSFENLLFSICRFRELTGDYPGNITVISYDFKKFRFSNLHRSALRFPASQFTFKGTPSAASSILEAQQGELDVQESFQKDPYGCEGSLRKKRLHRDPFLRTIPYPVGCPEIAGLFSYCGTDFYSKSLPWDKR